MSLEKPKKILQQMSLKQQIRIFARILLTINARLIIHKQTISRSRESEVDPLRVKVRALE